MFVLIILILGSSSFEIEICTVMSILDVPCNQKCIKAYSPDTEVVTYFNQCFDSYPSLTICLIYTSILLESCLQSFSPCFSEESLKNIEETISLVKSQDECISYFTISTLVKFSKIDNHFLNSENYILQNTDIEDCNIKTLMLGNRLAQYALENKGNRYVKCSIKLLLKEHGQFINVEETNENNEYIKNCKKTYSFQSSNEIISFDKFTSKILNILVEGEFYAYSRVIRILEYILSQLKYLLPKIVFEELQKILGDRCNCSHSINSPIDIGILFALLKEELGYGSIIYDAIFGIGNYFYQ